MYSMSQTIYGRKGYNICGDRVGLIGTMGYDRSKTKIVSSLWDELPSHEMKCPQCGGHLIIIQIQPIEDSHNPYTSYETSIECISCSYHTHATSLSILGSIKSFDHQSITIVGWSPSGNRVTSIYEHILDYDLLRELESSEEIVEFLVVDGHVVQVIS